MPATGIQFTEEQIDTIDELRRGMYPIADPEDDDLRNRSQVVRILVELGLAALKGMEDLGFEMEPQNAVTEVRWGMRERAQKQMERDGEE